MVELWSSDRNENRTMVADPSAVPTAPVTHPTYTRRRRRPVPNTSGEHTVISESVPDTYASSPHGNVQGDPTYVCPLVSPISWHLACPDISALDSATNNCTLCSIDAFSNKSLKISRY